MKDKVVIRSLAIGLVLLSGAASTSDDRIDVSQFSDGKLEDWDAKSFVGETSYDLVKDSGATVLKATSHSSASGLGKKVRIDLEKTPYVNWRWKIDNRLQSVDETTREGDDYPARLYLIKSGGAFIWRTRSLNYVWSSNQSQGAVWPNAFRPKNAVMLAVRGANDRVGEWVTEKRNVREDLKAAFGKDITRIDGVAIMTDTDNSGQHASASYGEIYFTAN